MSKPATSTNCPSTSPNSQKHVNLEPCFDLWAYVLAHPILLRPTSSCFAAIMLAIQAGNAIPKTPKQLACKIGSRHPCCNLAEAAKKGRLFGPWGVLTSSAKMTLAALTPPQALLSPHDPKSQTKTRPDMMPHPSREVTVKRQLFSSSLTGISDQYKIVM